MPTPVRIGTTDRSIFVHIPDPASTDGGGRTGLVAANLTVSYSRMETDNDAVNTDVTSSLNNLGSLTAAHNDWGWLEVSSTLAPGLYRLDIADAVFATGAWSAVVTVMITSSAASVTHVGFDLVSHNPLALADLLASDTYAEPSGVPSATATLAAKINTLYAALIGPVEVTATKKQFSNFAGTKQWEKDLADSGTAYTETVANAI